MLRSFILLITALLVSISHAQDYEGKDQLIKQYAAQADTVKETNVPLAISCWDKVEARARQINDKPGLMQAFFERALMYSREGKYTRANNDMIAAIKLSEELKRKDLTVYFQLFQFDFFFNMENFELATRQLKELEEDIKTADPRLQMRYLNQEAELARKLNDYPKAEILYRKSVKMALAAKDLDAESIASYYLGNCLYHMGKCKEALPFVLRAVEIDSLDNYPTGLMTDYAMVAQVYIDCLKNADVGLDYLGRMERLHKQVNIDRPMDVVYDLYADAWKLKGNYKLALEYVDKRVAVKDSLYSLDEKAMLAEVQNNFQVEKKQEQIKSLKASEKASKEKTQLAYTGLVLAVLMILGIGYGYFNSKRYNGLLRAREQHKELLLQEVHHRINNSLQLISSLISIQARTSGNEAVKDILKQTEMRVHSMAAMHDLLNESKSPVNINVKQYLNTVLEFHQQVLHNRPNLQLNVSIEGAVMSSNKALPLALMVNELVTNAIKYAFPDDRAGKIDIVLKEEEPGNWLFSVADNGIGLPDEYSAMLQKNQGLGCQIVHIMVDQIDGKLTTSNRGGASFNVQFKV